MATLVQIPWRSCRLSTTNGRAARAGRGPHHRQPRARL